MAFGNYRFLSWARRGISASITEKDTLGQSAGNEIERAKVPIDITLNGNINIPQKKFTLVGPGDIIGVHSDMIVRTEPRDGISNYEPNYLPYIEFYDEDFPWRYTPASAAGLQGESLRPWLTLLVLGEDEFEDTPRQTPLKSIKINNSEAMPPIDELHLWAHMHSNLPTVENPLETFIDQIKRKSDSDPDGIYSRLLSPRKLEAKKLYYSFLVPTFETGRLAGLDRPTAGIKAQQLAWGQNTELEFPVFYRWHFRTGENFDFESLVKLIEPRVMDKRVGIRPMDCSKPEYFKMDSTDEIPAPDPAIIMLEGAAKAPTAVSTTIVPNEYQAELAKLVNLNRVQIENPNTDPFVTVPYYGMYHAMRKDLANPGGKIVPVFNENSDVWYNDLNRDPRTRVPAGFGTKAVQDDQEKLMDEAWKQLQNVLEANKKMKMAQMMANVLDKGFNKFVLPLDKEKVLPFTRMVSAKIMSQTLTVKAQITESKIPDALFTYTFSKLTRPNTTLIRNLSKTDQAVAIPQLMKATNSQIALTADSIDKFAGVNSVLVANILAPESLSNIKVWSLQSNLEKSSVFNAKEYIGGFPKSTTWNKNFETTILRSSTEAVAVQPGVVVQPNPNLGTVPRVSTRARRVGDRVNDPITATTAVAVAPVFRAHAEFKTAFTEYNARYTFRDEIVAPIALDINIAFTKTMEAINPKLAYKRMMESQIKWGLGTFRPAVDDFLPALAYPDFPKPAYKFLVDRDKELILPNLHLIQPNTFSLLRTNQKFIESYMVGLNHEMGKELLWREYPTDMRGSYFRQFWDVKGFITPDSTPKDADALKDIAPIHKWPKFNKLGQNNARDKEGDSEQLVFVVRGDLLKKFPNTVIFAQKAFKEGGKIILHQNLTDVSMKTEVRFPLYQAEIPADIKLLGFDLTIEEAAGIKPVSDFSTNKEGWFFVIAEVPGEPRFGMDINYKKENVATWNDLSWENFNGEKLSFISSKKKPGNTGKPGGSYVPPNNDAKGFWGRSSADMATILFQRPVMVAVHSSEMLDKEINDQNKGFHDITKLMVEYNNYKLMVDSN